MKSLSIYLIKVIAVSILTGKPNYPTGSYYKGYNFYNKNFEKINDINIYRAPVVTRGTGSSLRLVVNWISFAFFSIFRILTINEKFDKIFVYQPSPFTVAIPALVARLNLMRRYISGYKIFGLKHYQLLVELKIKYYLALLIGLWFLHIIDAKNF